MLMYFCVLETQLTWCTEYVSPRLATHAVSKSVGNATASLQATTVKQKQSFEEGAWKHGCELLHVNDTFTPPSEFNKLFSLLFSEKIQAYLVTDSLYIITSF